MKNNKSNAMNSLKAEVILGKNGLTENAIKNIISLLKKKKTIKIKMSPAFLDLKKGPERKEEAERVARECNSRLIAVRGGSIVVSRIKTKNK